MLGKQLRTRRDRKLKEMSTWNELSRLIYFSSFLSISKFFFGTFLCILDNSKFNLGRSESS